MTARLAFPDPSPASGSLLSDEQLLQRYAAGQRDALDDLFRRYRQPAFCVAIRHLDNEADALDAVQEGFAQAFIHILRFQGRSSFKTWLLSIVARAAMNLGRKCERRGRLLQRLRHNEKRDVHHGVADHRSPLHELVAQEEEEAVQVREQTIRLCVRKQATPRMQLVSELRLAGWTFAKIAEKLQVCEKTARLDMDRFSALVAKVKASLDCSVR